MEIKDVLFLIINFGILIATIIMAAKQTDYLVHLAFYRQNEKGPDPVESSRFFKFLPIETRLTLLNIYASLLVIVYHIRRQKPTLRCGFLLYFLQRMCSQVRSRLCRNPSWWNVEYCVATCAAVFSKAVEATCVSNEGRACELRVGVKF